MTRRLARSLAGLALALHTLTACGSAPARTAGAPPKSTAAEATRILSFAVSDENLHVDKVGMRDGAHAADGSLDLAFRATTEGPVSALFIVSCDETGHPTSGYRAHTLVGESEAPAELGGALELGHMGVGIGVFVDGAAVNRADGSLHIDGGTHQLALYTSNTGTLLGGSHVRLYVQAPSGELVAGPVVAY